MKQRSPWWPRLRVSRDWRSSRRYLEVDVPGLPTSRPVARVLLGGRVRVFVASPF